MLATPLHPGQRLFGLREVVGAECVVGTGCGRREISPWGRPVELSTFTSCLVDE